ncbi:MAG: ABC transporter permease [Bacteroidota bacterium]|jgi:putative ABC transport system permease protein|nr:ABC transporter permease [Cytophagales bacterium]
MLRNYIKIAFRSLVKNQTYSIINIGGLAIGLASSILIFLWVADEYSYDTFHVKYNNIYKVYNQAEWNGHIGTGNSQPYPLKEALLAKSSGIKHVVMTNWGEGNMLQVGETRLNKYGLNASEDFFKVFTYEWLSGDPATALNELTSIVITESTAKALFNSTDALNKTIRIDNSDELKVTGVVKDSPKQSFLEYDYILPFSYYEKTNPWIRNFAKTSWDSNSFQMYVLLQDGASKDDVEKAVVNLIRDNNPKSPTAKLLLHPMSMWRLYSNWEEGVNTGGQIVYVRLFTAIAIFVLIIACINFMNLATARSESRAREVGIRKSIGSRRKELIFQFLGESITVTAIAFLLAIVLVELALPSYNLLVKKNIFIDYRDGQLWLAAIGLVLLIGTLSGSYPSLYLSSFDAVKVLKGKVNLGKGASTPRKVLVTLQFGFSIFLIVGTIVIYQQIQFVKNRDMGYDRENLIQMWINGEMRDNFSSIREELLRTGVVQSVCKSNSPVTAIFSNNEVKWQGKENTQRVAFSTIATEYDYIQTMGVKMIEGRDFSREFNDSLSVIVNEAALKIMGMTDPIGKKLEINNTQFNIVGVIPDMVMDSPYTPVQPMTLLFDPSWSSTVTLRLTKTNDLPASMAKVEAVFKKLNPNYPFQYRFTDVDFEKKFSSINLISRLAGIFAGLAIFITCLGLFGLAAFTAEQRTKEVGIRKVMGASVSSLVLLISKDFSRLVIFAFLISAPISWWFLNDFLQRYEYRIEVAWWVLLAVGVFALVLALIIVSTQALKAAVMNPTRSLRSE